MSTVFPSHRLLLVAALVVGACGLPDEVSGGSDLDELDLAVQATDCPLGTAEETCSGTGLVWSSLYRVGREADALGEVAQTFQVAQAGLPEQVRLKLRLLRPLLDATDLTVAIRPLVGGVIPRDPATDLARGTVAINTLSRTLPGENSIALSSTTPASPVSLATGTTYALVLSAALPASGGVFVGVASHKADSYPNGAIWRRAARASGGTFEDRPFTAGSDGADLSFALKVAAAPSCSDGLQNGTETGVDCGGSCAACSVPDSSVSSLLHFDGPNGSTAFPDALSWTWTRAGNVQVSTSSSRFGGASASFDGAGDSLSSPANPAFRYADAQPHTLELWFNGTGTVVGNESYGYVLVVKSGRLHAWIPNVLPWNASGTDVGAVAPGWHHLAVGWDGTTYRIHLDGAQLFAANGGTPIQTTDVVVLGAYGGGAQPYFAGYLDDFRMTKGFARYTTTSFAVPTAAFPTP